MKPEIREMMTGPSQILSFNIRTRACYTCVYTNTILLRLAIMLGTIPNPQYSTSYCNLHLVILFSYTLLRDSLVVGGTRMTNMKSIGVVRFSLLS